MFDVICSCYHTVSAVILAPVYLIVSLVLTWERCSCCAVICILSTITAATAAPTTGEETLQKTVGIPATATVAAAALLANADTNISCSNRYRKTIYYYYINTVIMSMITIIIIFLDFNNNDDTLEVAKLLT